MRSTTLLIAAIVSCCLLALAAAAQQPRVDGTGVRVIFTVDYKVTAGPKTKFAEVTIVLPKTLEGRQKVHKIEYSKEPTKVFDEGGYSLARFVFDNPAETKKFAVTVDADVYRYDLATAMAVDKKRRQFDNKEELEKFKVEEKYLEKDARSFRRSRKSFWARPRRSRLTTRWFSLLPTSNGVRLTK